jgi:hypothetical protein
MSALAWADVKGPVTSLPVPEAGAGGFLDELSVSPGEARSVEAALQRAAAALRRGSGDKRDDAAAGRLVRSQTATRSSLRPATAPARAVVHVRVPCVVLTDSPRSATVRTESQAAESADVATEELGKGAVSHASAALLASLEAMESALSGGSRRLEAERAARAAAVAHAGDAALITTAASAKAFAVPDRSPSGKGATFQSATVASASRQADARASRERERFVALRKGTLSAGGRDAAASAPSGTTLHERLTASRQRQIAEMRAERDRSQVPVAPAALAGTDAAAAPSEARVAQPTACSSARSAARVASASARDRREQRLQRQPSDEEVAPLAALSTALTMSARRREAIVRSNLVDVAAPAPASEPAAHVWSKSVVATMTEASHAWAGRWGTRELREALWTGPSGEEPGEPVGQTGGVVPRHPAAPAIGLKSAVLVGQMQGKLSVREHTSRWVQRSNGLRARESEPESQEPPLLPPELHCAERLAVLRARQERERRLAEDSTSEFAALLASLPGPFREAVLASLEPPQVGGQEVHLEVDQPDETIDVAGPRRGHHRYLQQHVEQTEQRRSERPAPTSLSLFRPKPAEEHVRRLRAVRLASEARDRELQRQMVAEGWTPKLTKPVPFRLSGSRAPAAAPADRNRKKRRRKLKHRKRSGAEFAAAASQVTGQGSATASQDGQKSTVEMIKAGRAASARSVLPSHVLCDHAGSDRGSDPPLARSELDTVTTELTSTPRSLGLASSSTVRSHPTLFRSREDIEAFLRSESLLRSAAKGRSIS